MSSRPPIHNLGLPADEAAALGPHDATRVRMFRLLLLVAQQLRTQMDHLLRSDGVTTQQAALITVIDVLSAPSQSQAAAMLGTTHQNVKQLATALERKGLIAIVEDRSDRRVRRLRTTARSDAIWRRRSASDQKRVLEWFSGLSDEEAHTLFELLLKLHGGLREAS